MLDKLIILLIDRLAAWAIGKQLFAAAVDAVQRWAGDVDLNGDGKKGAVLDELKALGYVFTARAGNFLVELALQKVERLGK